jgi:hypothetical protein
VPLNSLDFSSGRVAGGQAFEGVPQDGIAGADAVRREVALEHASVRAERGDAALDIRFVGARQFLRRRRRLARVEVEHAEQHAEPAELDDDVLALTEFGDAGLPYGEGFLLLVRVGAETSLGEYRTAAVRSGTVT